MFEECELRCLRDTAIKDQKSYIFASRTVQTNNANKGYVLFNCNVTVEDGVTAYYGRNSGSDTQATVVFNTFNKIDKALWGGAATKLDVDVSGIASIGYKDYGNKLTDGTEISTADRLANTYTLSKEVAEREYCGRNAILNRGWKASEQKYVPCTAQWDLSTFESDYNASEDKSKKMIYLEPTYVPYLEAGTTESFTATNYKGTAVTVTGWESSDNEFATVAGGTATAVEKVVDGEKQKGIVTIIATAAEEMKGVAQIYVIPEVVLATGIALDWEATKEIEVGDEIDVTATYTPADATDQSVIWESSDTNVLRVTGSGPKGDGLTAKVIGFSDGTATLTAKSKNIKGSYVTATCDVTVKKVYAATYLSEGTYTKAASILHRDATVAASPVTYGFAGSGITQNENEPVLWGNDGWKITALGDVSAGDGADFFWAEFPIRAAGEIVLKSVSADLYSSASSNIRAMVYAKVDGDYTNYLGDGINATDKAMHIKKAKLGDDGITVPAGSTATVKIAIAMQSGKTVNKNLAGVIGNVVIYYEPKGTPIAFPGADGEYNIKDYATAAEKVAEHTPMADGQTADGMISWTDVMYHSEGYGLSCGKNKSTNKFPVIKIKVGGPSVITQVGSQWSGGSFTVTNEAGDVIATCANTKLEKDGDTISFLYTGTGTDELSMAYAGGTSYVGKITVKELTTEKAEVTEVKINGATTVSTAAPSKFTASVKATYCASADVTWSSSDETIATVAADGTVTGVKAGKVTITATSKVDTTKSDSIEVTISEEELNPEVGESHEYIFKDKSVTIVDGEKGSSSDTFCSWDANWKYFNGDYGIKAQVANAKIFLKVAGDVVIGYSGYEGAKAIITVTDEEENTIISVPAKTAKYGYNYFIYKGDATTLTFTASTADCYIAGLTVKPWVNEVPMVESVSITGPDTVSVGAKSTFAANVTGKYFPDDLSVTWTSSDPSVASVDPTTGEVTGEAEGSCTITATSNLTSTAKGTKNITVSSVQYQTVAWDFTGSQMTSVDIQTAKGVVTDVNAYLGVTESTSVKMSVEFLGDSGNGKLSYNSSGYAQFNKDTQLSIDVKTGDVVTIVAYSGQAKYKVDGVQLNTETDNTYVYTATEDKTLVILATGGAYIYSIKLERTE